MNKELEALKENRKLVLFNSVSDRAKYSDNANTIENALKTLELIQTKVFDKEKGLQLEKWVHYDGHYSYHINYGMTEEWDIVITKEEYNLLNKVIYEKEN